MANDGQGIDTLREEWERLFGVPDSSLRSELPGIQECREVVSSRDCLWTAEWLWQWLCHCLADKYVKSAFLFQLVRMFLSPESQ